MDSALWCYVASLDSNDFNHVYLSYTGRTVPVTTFGRTVEVKNWGKDKVVEWLAENDLHAWVLTLHTQTCFQELSISTSDIFLNTSIGCRSSVIHLAPYSCSPHVIWTCFLHELAAYESLLITWAWGTYITTSAPFVKIMISLLIFLLSFHYHCPSIHPSNHPSIFHLFIPSCSIITNFQCWGLYICLSIPEQTVSYKTLMASYSSDSTRSDMR